jgi:hypothetical protein
VTSIGQKQNDMVIFFHDRIMMRLHNVITPYYYSNAGALRKLDGLYGPAYYLRFA